MKIFIFEDERFNFLFAYIIKQSIKLNLKNFKWLSIRFWSKFRFLTLYLENNQEEITIMEKLFVSMMLKQNGAIYNNLRKNLIGSFRFNMYYESCVMDFVILFHFLMGLIGIILITGFDFNDSFSFILFFISYIVSFFITGICFSIAVKEVCLWRTIYQKFFNEKRGKRFSKNDYLALIEELNNEEDRKMAKEILKAMDERLIDKEIAEFYCDKYWIDFYSLVEQEKRMKINEDLK